MESSEAQWAWAAGLFEGEGCIVIYSDSRRARVIQRPKLYLGMTDRDVVLRLRDVTGVGNVRPKVHGKRPDHYKPMWQWNVGKKNEVKFVLTEMMPWFGERRQAKALEAVELCVYIYKGWDRGGI